jgi:hypothetical protein
VVTGILDTVLLPPGVNPIAVKYISYINSVGVHVGRTLYGFYTLSFNYLLLSVIIIIITLLNDLVRSSFVSVIDSQL